ncbi:PREDICTED: CMRF35-like molecule 1 isoform X5 [Cercocebus atys]|uniref:CMRF35-like molecule 1 isoform X5 n=1 Tax=Cercocebus atys TaxID=9531 RepID=UPI0005F448CB|nr:PREDICTED: CMRF35-like molecule 1 isoform X5 [Cercocebus atys]
MWLPQLHLMRVISAKSQGYSIATDISGPMTVNGPERGSLMVQCVYNSDWETYLKWWCRGATWYGCKILVKTTGSEQEVKRDRVSIKDNQKNHTFTVTMEDLMQTDADTYWCGIERTGTDLGVIVQVIIDPASTAAPTTSASTTFTAPVTPEETSNSPTLTGHHLDKSGWDVPRAGKILPKAGPERPGSFFPLPHFPSPRRSKISDKSCAKVSRPHGPLQGLGAEGLEAARGMRAEGYGSLRSGDTEGTGRGAPREVERLLSHHGKGTCVHREIL